MQGRNPVDTTRKLTQFTNLENSMAGVYAIFSQLWRLMMYSHTSLCAYRLMEIVLNLSAKAIPEPVNYRLGQCFLSLFLLYLRKKGGHMNKGAPKTN